MITQIGQTLYLGSHHDRLDPMFDVVVSIISTKPIVMIKEGGRIEEYTESPVKYAPIDGKEVIHINLADRELGMLKALEVYAPIVTRRLYEAKNVFVHCNKGRSRSVSFVMGLLMHMGHSPMASYTHVLNARAEADPQPWHGFIMEINQYNFNLRNGGE